MASKNLVLQNSKIACQRYKNKIAPSSDSVSTDTTEYIMKVLEYMMYVTPGYVPTVIDILGEDVQENDRAMELFTIYSLVETVIDSHEDGEKELTTEVLDKFKETFDVYDISSLTNSSDDSVPDFKSLYNELECEFKMQICLHVFEKILSSSSQAQSEKFGLIISEDNRNYLEQIVEELFPRKLLPKDGALRVVSGSQGKEEEDDQSDFVSSVIDVKHLISMKFASDLYEILDSLQVYTQKNNSGSGGKAWFVSKVLLEKLKYNHPWTEFAETLKEFANAYHLFRYGPPDLLKPEQNEQVSKVKDMRATTTLVAAEKVEQPPQSHRVQLQQDHQARQATSSTSRVSESTSRMHPVEEEESQSSITITHVAKAYHRKTGETTSFQDILHGTHPAIRIQRSNEKEKQPDLVLYLQEKPSSHQKEKEEDDDQSSRTSGHSGSNTSSMVVEQEVVQQQQHTMNVQTRLGKASEELKRQVQESGDPLDEALGVHVSIAAVSTTTHTTEQQQTVLPPRKKPINQKAKQKKRKISERNTTATKVHFDSQFSDNSIGNTPPPKEAKEEEDMVVNNNNNQVQQQKSTQVIRRTTTDDEEEEGEENKSHENVRKSKRQLQLAALPQGDAPSLPLSPLPVPRSTGVNETLKLRKAERRKRVKFTLEEEEALRDGVEEHGVGFWKQILTDEKYPFHPCRTAVNLKDKWRNLMSKS